jgi:hypothetical protein
MIFLIRVQNSNIFVKNIHWVAALLNEVTPPPPHKTPLLLRISTNLIRLLCDQVASALGVGVGEYTHWITNLCFDRTATSC